MTDFSKILDKAKELENKMKESQEKIKSIEVEGISGSNSVKVTLNGQKIVLDGPKGNLSRILPSLVCCTYDETQGKLFL